MVMKEWLELARQVSPWPGAEVQVYRAREGDRPGKCTEFLETMVLTEWVTLERLTEADGDDLEGMIPIEETQLRWGGGDYQFRFRWRDEDGNVVKRRSRNASIFGRPNPKRP